MELNTINQNLLNEVKGNGYEVSFDNWQEENMGAFTQNKKAIIYFGTGKNSQADITHELLHVKMKSFGYFSAKYFRQLSNPNSILFKVFDNRLCDHISNCMDHIKMYPMFLEYGYKPIDFLSNGDVKLASIRELKRIRLKRWRKLSAKNINRFIGNQIAMLADHLENDYTEHYRVLIRKNKELFRIINDFWLEWEGFDITEIDPLVNYDKDVMDNFINDLENWLQKQ